MHVFFFCCFLKSTRANFSTYIISQLSHTRACWEKMTHSLRALLCKCTKLNPPLLCHGQWQEPIKAAARKSFRLTPRSEVAITQKHCPPLTIFLYLWITALGFSFFSFLEVCNTMMCSAHSFHDCRLLSGFEVPLWHGRPISGSVQLHGRALSVRSSAERLARLPAHLHLRRPPPP